MTVVIVVSAEVLVLNLYHPLQDLGYTAERGKLCKNWKIGRVTKNVIFLTISHCKQVLFTTENDPAVGTRTGPFLGLFITAKLLTTDSFKEGSPYSL